MKLSSFLGSHEWVKADRKAQRLNPKFSSSYNYGVALTRLRDSEAGQPQRESPNAATGARQY